MRTLSLYKISNEYQKLLYDLYDHETGEINPEVDLQLKNLSSNLEDKCIAVASFIQGLEYDLLEVIRLLEDLSDREDELNEKITKWGNYLKNNMIDSGLTKANCPYFTINIKKNPYSTQILDESLIPEEYVSLKETVKVEQHINKVAIKNKVIETGIQIPGAYVQQKTKLEITTKL